MVDQIFTVINFVVLLALGYVIFKKYGLPAFERKAVDQVKYIQNLKNEKSELLKKQDMLQVEIALQEQRCKELVIKATAWEKAVINERKTAEIEYQKTRERIHEKVRVQSVHYNLENIYTQITPEVIELLTRDLKHYYTNNDNAHRYISQALNKLEKNTI